VKIKTIKIIESPTPTLGKISEKKKGTTENCNDKRPTVKAKIALMDLFSPKRFIFVKIPKTIAKINKKGKTKLKTPVCSQVAIKFPNTPP
jgi:hypothetical protein